MGASLTKDFREAVMNRTKAARRERKAIQFECVVCMTSFRTTSHYGTDQCGHRVCRECTRQYLKSIIKTEQRTSFDEIQCPSLNCSALLNMETIITKVFNKTEAKDWRDKAIIKTHIENKIRCPFLDCRALFDTNIELTRQCTFSECYECHRGFCIACQNHWHPGRIKIVDDREEAHKAIQLAEKKLYTRCPKCENIVEKENGCSTMYCKCGTTFCYRCGGLSNNHTCLNRCHQYTSEKLNEVRQDMFNHTYQKLKLKKVV